MKKFLILILSAFSFFSCDSDNAEELTPVEEEKPPTDPVNAKVTYEKNIVPILEGDCFNCHGDPLKNRAPVGTKWTTFENVKNNIQKIKNRINNADNPMPPGRLISQSNRDKFDQWIEDGLLEK